VPQFGRIGRIPAGSGPFSAGNYYQLGSGNDVLDFTGSFYIAILFSIVGSPNAQALFNNSDTGSVGYRYQMNTGAIFDGFAGGTKDIGDNANLISGAINLILFGRVGNAIYGKTNGKAMVSQAPTGAYAAATSSPTTIGWDFTGTQFTGNVYELLASGTSPGADAATVDAFFSYLTDKIRRAVSPLVW